MNFERLLSIPKSLYVCLKLLGFRRALRLPILVRYNTIILSLEGKVIVSGGGRILIGFGRISEFDKKYERSIIKLDGDITFSAPCNFGLGTRIVSEKNSKLYIGRNFSNTAKLTLSNRGEIEIGENCLVSWNTWICDTSFHRIINFGGNPEEYSNGKVKIGNHVWMCANSSVHRGASIPDNCVIATGSLVLGGFNEPNSLIAGSPAKIKKRNIAWDL